MKRWIVALAIVIGVAGVASLSGAPTSTQAGTFPGQVITSAGPLSQIFVADDLGCQVEYTGIPGYQFYSSSDEQGNCGTFLYVGSTVYGEYGSWGDNEFTPVSQTAVTGSGTSGSPYQVVTVVDAGATGFRITQTDSYTVGDEFYRTDINVSNTTGSTAAIKLYRGADCYLDGSDDGYGYLDSVGGVVGCTVNANNSPPALVELWTPITAVSFYGHGDYSDIRGFIEDGDDLPNTCLCEVEEDNGGAIQWNADLGAGANTTYSHFTTFSPTGAGAPSPTPSSGSAKATEELPPKTHTPMPSATAKPSETPAPATNTALPANTTVLPPPPGGGQAGTITAPDTGSGPGAGDRQKPLLIGIALAALAGGAGLIVATKRVRS